MAKCFHEIVVPTCFGNTVHYTCVDLGQSAGVVKVVGSPTEAGTGRELMECISLENQTRLPARWLGERTPTRISSNPKEGTGNIKLEVFSWSVAKKLVTDGIMIKGKKRNVEL